MINILIGNIIALLSSTFMVISGIVKEKKKVLFYQIIEVILALIAYVFLNTMSGVIINALNLVRNILGYNNKLNVVAKIIISILSIILVLYFNNNGLIGLLPLITILVWIWAMTIENVILFKLIFAFNISLWIVYDLNVKNYVAFVFDIITIISIFISIIRIKKGRKK